MWCTAPAGRCRAPPEVPAAKVSIGFVLATIAVDAMAFGIVIPVVPGLVMTLSGQDPSGASVWLGALLGVFSAAQRCRQWLSAGWCAASASAAAIAGFLLSGCAYACYAVAWSVWLLLAGIVLQALAAVSGPAVQAMVSIRAGPDRQGGMQGALGSFQGLTAVFTPILAGWVFGLATRPGSPVDMPGAPFLLAVGAYIVAWWAVRGLPETRPGHR